jgi:hypothetical protein
MGDERRAHDDVRITILFRVAELAEEPPCAQSDIPNALNVFADRVLSSLL